MKLFRRREAARFRNPMISEETARVRNPLIQSRRTVDEPAEVALARRDPAYNWRGAMKLTPGFFVELLRSDELPLPEMNAFREAAPDWKRRDRAIASARRSGRFTVHPYADRNSVWAKAHQDSSLAFTPSD